MESDSESNSNVRSMLDHAGRMIDDAVDQLNTPEKDARNITSERKRSDGGSSTGKTPCSQQRREAEEFPWSHDVYSLGKTPKKPKMTARRTRGSLYLLMTLVVGVLYGVLIASSGCMMVAHVELLDRVIPQGAWKRLSKATDMYRAHVEPIMETYVVPYARVAHDEVCTRRVNPYIMMARDVTASSWQKFKSLYEKTMADMKEKMAASRSTSLPSSSSLVARAPTDGNKKPSPGHDLMQLIQRQFATFGRNMVFWGRPMRTDDASSDPIALFLQRHVIPQAVVNVTPPWVLINIVQPFAVLVCTVGGLSIAFMLLAVVMKKTVQD